MSNTENKQVKDNQVVEASSEALTELGVEAEFVDEAVGVLDESQKAYAEAKSSLPGIWVQANQSQHQTVIQDNTTVNNIFRGELKEDASIWKKITIELLLNVIEPDRLLKNAKAVFIILAGIAIFRFLPSLSFTELKELLQLVVQIVKGS